MIAFDFSGRVALVTGGANGIGQAAVELLKESGAKVGSLDRVASSAADRSVIADVTDRASLRAAVEDVTEALGPIDVLVCAAGIFAPPMPTVEVDEETWDRVFGVNTRGTYAAIQEVLPGMVSRGYGRIVTLGSVSAFEGVHDADLYAASKAAVISLTRTVGRDVAKTGVLVNCVVPALIETAMASELSGRQYQESIAKIPLGRLGKPREVATLIAYLASENLSFSTGACFDVTGGRADW
ncbi:MAG: SDR family oxidoreductase [Actinobacteria bacterium]|nr:SDR family oxidoreductase [Actinomycetota bacterium]